MYSRRDYILKLIVEYFVKTAQPLGSKTLIDLFNLDFSSATIRNEMQTLEQEGFLEKTHTSSGRVPSSKGYEYYIQNLRERTNNAELQYQLSTMLNERMKTVEDILTESCEILSEMTNLVSLVIGNLKDEETLSSLSLIPISKNSATVIFVTSKGNVENKTFFFDKDIKLDDLASCISVLNKRLVGTKIEDLILKAKTLKPLLFDSFIDGDGLYQSLLKTMTQLNNDRIILIGKEKLLDQPEFNSDPEKLKKIISMIDSKEFFNDISKELGLQKDISVKVGSENSEYKDISVISAKVNIPGAENKYISLIGPTRMDYQEAFNAIEILLEELDKRYKKD